MPKVKLFNYNKDYLSRENTNCLKGIFAFCVILHHLSQNVHIYDYSVVASIFQFMGYLSVAVFFFFSGYGLVFSYDKRTDYIKLFPKSRLLDFYFKYLVIIAIYFIYDIIFGVEISLDILLKTFFFGGTIVANGWYFQTLLVVYLLFFLIFKLFKNTNTQIFAYGLGLICFCVLTVYLNIDLIVIECVFCVLFGMLWARKKEKIDKLFFGNRKSFFYFCVVLMCFSFTLVLWNIINVGYLVVLFIKFLSAIFFVIMVCFIANYINLKNKLTVFLGNYFLELYAFHGMFIKLFRNVFLIKNDYIIIVLVISSSLVFAFIMHPLFNSISKVLKNGLRVKKNEY